MTASQQIEVKDVEPAVKEIESIVKKSGGHVQSQSVREDDQAPREQVIQYYIDKYGSPEPLAAPIDKGFNRLAWLFPYVAGGLGAVAVGMYTVRWSRRPRAGAETVSAVGPAADPKLEERLDDELSNLD